MSEMFDKIRILSKKGLSLEEIAEKTDLTIFTIKRYNLVLKRGFESYYKYQKHLAKERGFKSVNEYEVHLAKKKGFKSVNEYQKHLAKERGFKSLHEYQKHLAKERGFKSDYEYQKHLAKRGGWKSLNDYRNYHEKEHQKQPRNKRFSKMIYNALEKLEKNQAWLAHEANLSRESISLYVQGKSFPIYIRLKKIFSILRLPYKTLEDLLK